MAANIKNSKFVPLNGNNHVILEGDEGVANLNLKHIPCKNMK